jgi:phosphoglycolate phosphatase
MRPVPEETSGAGGFSVTRFRGAMFDLDGTLLDTIDDITVSMNKVLSRRRWPTHTVEEYKLLVGGGVEELVRKSIPIHGITEPACAECIQELKVEYNKHWADTTRPYEGIPEMLRHLKKIGMYLGVLSNKPEDLVLKCVEKFFPDILFDRIRGARHGIPQKPDPSAALQICQELGSKSNEWLYFGDSGIDMVMANRAGMMSVGVLWGFRSSEELKNSGAQRLVSSWNQLIDLVM